MYRVSWQYSIYTSNQESRQKKVQELNLYNAYVTRGKYEIQIYIHCQYMIKTENTKNRSLIIYVSTGSSTENISTALYWIGNKLISLIIAQIVSKTFLEYQ